MSDLRMLDQSEFTSLSDSDKWRTIRDALERIEKLERVAEAALIVTAQWKHGGMFDIADLSAALAALDAEVGRE